MTVAMIALFAALAGTAWAAGLAKNSVKSKQIKDGQVRTQDLADSAVTSPKIVDGSLLSQDFAAGQIPAGERGPQGIQGPPGPSTGPAGGDLAGNYPDPTIAAGSVGVADLDPATVADVISESGTFPDDNAFHVLTTAAGIELSGVCDGTGSNIGLTYKNVGDLTQNVLIGIRDAGDANPGVSAAQTPTHNSGGGVNFGTFTGPAEGSIWAADANHTMRMEIGIAHGADCRYWTQAIVDPD